MGLRCVLLLRVHVPDPLCRLILLPQELLLLLRLLLPVFWRLVDVNRNARVKRSGGGPFLAGREASEEVDRCGGDKDGEGRGRGKGGERTSVEDNAAGEIDRCSCVSPVHDSRDGSDSELEERDYGQQC